MGMTLLQPFVETRLVKLFWYFNACTINSKFVVKFTSLIFVVISLPRCFPSVTHCNSHPYLPLRFLCGWYPGSSCPKCRRCSFAYRSGVVDLTVVSLLPDQAGTSSVTVMFLMFALPYFHKVIPGALTNKKPAKTKQMVLSKFDILSHAWMWHVHCNATGN